MRKTKNPKILDKFLTYLANVKSYSLQTIKGYEIDLLLFFRFIKKYCKINISIEEFNIFVLLNIREDEIISFLVYLNYNRNCTACTRARKIASIKCFYKWLFKKYHINELKNPTENLPTIQQINRLPKYLNLEKSKKIINIFNSKNSKFYIRDNTIIILFLNCGLRISELVNINLNDLDLINKTLKVKGKGNKERICYLNNSVVKSLRKYVKARVKNESIIDLSEPLFLSYRKDRIKTNAIRYIVKKAYKLAELESYHYTVHTLRHTSATILYQYVNSDILMLQKFLGHTSIKSTEIYTHISNEKVKEAVFRNPLANFGVEEEAEIKCI